MSRINNYEELVLEKKRLEGDITHYRSVIEGEIRVLKHKFEPLTNVVTFLGPSKNSSQNHNSLLQAGTNLGIELLVRQKLLAKSGWLTKLVLPFILKKVSSKAIETVQSIRK